MMPRFRVFGFHRWPLLVALLSLLAPVAAQPPSLPFAKLFTIYPCGGTLGTTVRVTIGGADLEEATNLYFSHPGFEARRVPDPAKAGQFVPNQFDVVIAHNVPQGFHDVRVLGKYGVSNPRCFVVGGLPEALEKEPNNNRTQAQEIPLGVTINGQIAPNVDVDYFKIAGAKGQRVVLHCLAGAIDSRMSPDLSVYTAAGKLRAKARLAGERNAILALEFTDDQPLFVRLCEHGHQFGDANSYYRLTVTTGPHLEAAFPPVVDPRKVTAVTLLGHNLPGGQKDPASTVDGLPLERLIVQLGPPPDQAREQKLLYSGELAPSHAGLDGFEYRFRGPTGESNPLLLTYATAPIVLDNGDNDDPAKAQEVPVPGEIAGRIEKRSDRDWYAFTAKAGEVIHVEGFADRIGSDLDLYFEMIRAENNQSFGETDEHPEAFAPLRFFARTDDPKVRFQVPADGKYLIKVSSREAPQFAGPHLVYRLSLRREQPDFRVVLLDLHPQNVGALMLGPGGQTQAEAIVYRRDGFAGPVTIEATSLPPGVSCLPQVISTAGPDAVLVFKAEPNAPPYTGPITLVAKAEIGGTTVTREVRGAVLVWPNPGEPNGVPAYSRLTRQIVLAVGEKPPFAVALDKTHAAVPAGATLPLKVTLNRIWPDAKVPVNIAALKLPPNVVFNGNNAAVAIPADKAEATLNLQVNANVPLGVHNVVLQGSAAVPFNKDPNAKEKPPINHAEPSSPLTLTVYNQVAQVSVDKPAVTIKLGAQEELIVRVSRLHGFQGPFKVQLVLPQGFAGVSAPEVTIPENANEGKLVLAAAAMAAPANNPGVIVRVVAVDQGVTLTTQATLNVTLVK
jgi:hypothetical protein